MIRRDTVRVFLPALYPVGALLIMAPLVDVVAAAWPVRFADAAWRFGTLGLEFQALLLQVVGFAVLLAVSAFMEHRAVLRTVSLAALCAAIALCAGVTRFVIDYRALHGLLDQSASRFDASAFRAMLSAIFAVPVLTSLGGRGFVASGDAPDPFDTGVADDAPSYRRPQSRAFRPNQVIPFPHGSNQPRGRRRV